MITESTQAQGEHPNSTGEITLQTRNQSVGIKLCSVNEYNVYEKKDMLLLVGGHTWLLYISIVGAYLLLS